MSILPRGGAVTAVLLAGCAVTACSAAAPPPVPEAARAVPTTQPTGAGAAVTLPSGRDVYLECRGQGAPTVVFISGGGLAADEWSTLAPGSAQVPVLDQRRPPPGSAPTTGPARPG